jgi:tetratricopeptide (TPR) repeat protein
MGAQPAGAMKGGAALLALAKSLEESLKRGQYDPSLLDSARRLNKMIEALPGTLQNADNLEYLKNKSMISEVLDYFGRFDEAKEVLKDVGAQTLERVNSRRKAALQVTDTETLKLAREQVRVCLEYAQTHYREHHYGPAQAIIRDCRDTVDECIVDEIKFPCYGTRARISYYLGRTLRQTNQYKQAESCFVDSIRYHHERAKKKLGDYGNDVKSKLVLEELEYARHKSAICLSLGLGWLSYTQGALARAKSYLMPARVLLLSVNDLINAAYVQLILGAIERSLAGKDRQKLDEAIELLDKPWQTFEKFGHLPYRARGILELSLAHLYAGSLVKAKWGQNEVQKYAEEKKDVRWRCNALILQSRISFEEAKTPAILESARRRILNNAEIEASQALVLAGDKDDPQVLCKIDALIARGEARIELGDFEHAREDLCEAIEINRKEDSRGALGRLAENTNPKIEAVCNLHLARLYINEKNAREAAVCLGRWKELREQVEHVSVRELAASIEEEFLELRTPFIREPGTNDLSLKKNRLELYAWLRREAAFRTDKKKEQNVLLDISGQTRSNYERELNEKDLPAKRTRRRKKR